MVALPGLESYTAEQMAFARANSHAFNRYDRFIKTLPVDSIHFDRHRAWMECVLASYFPEASGVTVTSQMVCRHFSDAADRVVRRAWTECGLDQFECALFALGKHGAQELNLSSDIDVMVVSEPREAFSVEKPLRRFMQMLQQSGDHGFCFRMDFDLRPGGKMGPLITSPSQFQDHYWSQGETWERLALVRLRALTGHAGLQKQILDLARKFSYRKFLDFTLLDDLKALRARVHQQGFERRDEELHLKLEVGGIRDIELFVHSLLVMNGGKLKELQTVSTQTAIELLQQHKLLPPPDAKLLLETYWYYRHVENLVQSVEDRQTHVMSPSLPALPGLPPRAEVEDKMKAIDHLVSTLLGSVDTTSLRLPVTEEAQLKWLKELGFSSEVVESIWPQLFSATALSHKNDRDERARQEFLFAFVGALAANESLDRDLGLTLLLDFVKATRAKATFFTTLLRTPRLINDLARLFCLSPYLGAILSSRPELLDHFILRVDEEWATDMESLLLQMSERKRLGELWAANQFLADRVLPELFARVTETADSICTQLLKQLKIEYPEASLEIVALGKWGGRELGLRSDLDFIFVSPRTPNESDFKVARRFISRLTEALKGGSLYELDLRLRPSGQSGPLLVQIDRLSEYWSGDAEPWQRQAYLRSRVLGQNVTLDKSLLVNRALTPAQLEELKVIRGKLLKPATKDTMDLKYAPGGLLDIEFVAQTALLAKQLVPPSASNVEMLNYLGENVPEWKPHSLKLTAIYAGLREFEQMLRLSAAHKIEEIRPDQPAFMKAARFLNLSPEKGWAHLSALLQEAREILNQLDPTGYRFTPAPV